MLVTWKNSLPATYTVSWSSVFCCQQWFSHPASSQGQTPLHPHDTGSTPAEQKQIEARHHVIFNDPANIQPYMKDILQQKKLSLHRVLF